MNRRAHSEECHATAALYALGALPRKEAQQFEQRLASGCPLCTAALSECAEVADLLAMSVPAVEPPADLRDRLLERIGAGSVKPLSAEMTLVRQGESRWRPMPVPGVEMRELLGDNLPTIVRPALLIALEEIETQVRLGFRKVEREIERL